MSVFSLGGAGSAAECVVTGAVAGGIDAGTSPDGASGGDSATKYGERSPASPLTLAGLEPLFLEETRFTVINYNRLYACKSNLGRHIAMRVTHSFLTRSFC